MGGERKVQLPSKWGGRISSRPCGGWDGVADHPWPGGGGWGVNHGFRLCAYPTSQKVSCQFTCHLKLLYFQTLELRDELFQAQQVLHALFEESFTTLKRLLSGITGFYVPQKFYT